MNPYQPYNDISMDETADWADMLWDTTVDRTGARTESLKDTGHEKIRLSACLAAKADRTKIKPMIVFKGALRETKAFNEEFRARCVTVSSSNARMNQTLTEEWVDKVTGKFTLGRRFLTWVSFACHRNDSVKEKLTKSKVDVVVVPGRCIKYIQLPDVSWNKPLKEHITRKYNEWIAESTHEYTAQGNMKAPLRRKIVECILEAWQELDSYMISSSLRSCGICLAVDGGQDELIHCFKEGQPCHDGAERLRVLARN